MLRNEKYIPYLNPSRRHQRLRVLLTMAGFAYRFSKVVAISRCFDGFRELSRKGEAR